MKTARAIGALALWAITACGGGKPEPADPEPVAADDQRPPAADAEAEKRAHLRTQQQGACRPMCERLTECSVEDLRANSSPEELAKMDLEKVAPAHTEQCTEDCNGRELSGRQVQVMRDCLGKPLACEPFVQCLDAAKQR